MARLGTEQDADVLLKDFGVTVTATIGSVTVSGYGIYDEPGEYLLGNDVVTRDRSVMVEAATFDGLSAEDDITVDGTDYTVADVLLQSDGVYARISLT